MPDLVVLYGVDCRCVAAPQGRGVVTVAEDADVETVAQGFRDADRKALAAAVQLAGDLSAANPGVPTAITTAAGVVVDVYQDGQALGLKAYPLGWDGGPDAVKAAAGDRRPPPPPPTPQP